MITVLSFYTQDYTHELICITEREKFLVPVKAIGARAILDFPDEVNFGTCPVKVHVESLEVNFSAVENNVSIEQFNLRLYIHASFCEVHSRVLAVEVQYIALSSYFTWGFHSA